MNGKSAFQLTMSFMLLGTFVHAGSAPSDDDARDAETNKLMLLRALTASVLAAEHPSVEPIAAALMGATSSIERRRLLSELRDAHYAREDAIRVLTGWLYDSDPSVRVQAAEILYTLGSNAGKETLLEVIRSSPAVAPGAPSNGRWAALVLNHFREVIPPDLLLGLQSKLGQPGVVDIMAMQGDPRYTPTVVALGKGHPDGSTLFCLGLLRAAEGRDAAEAMFRTAENPSDKIAAAWTLFRITGDRTKLDYVIRVAQQALDTNGRSNALPDEVYSALRKLYITRDEAVRNLLRHTMNLPFADIASSSLASLFYVQKDYGFVDGYVRGYLRSRPGTEGPDPNLVWQIAAARNQPDINKLAKEKSGDDFTYRSMFLPPRPAEGWIWSYLSDIPMH